MSGSLPKRWLTPVMSRTRSPKAAWSVRTETIGRGIGVPVGEIGEDLLGEAAVDLADFEDRDRRHGHRRGSGRRRGRGRLPDDRRPRAAWRPSAFPRARAGGSMRASAGSARLRQSVAQRGRWSARKRRPLLQGGLRVSSEVRPERSHFQSSPASSSPGPCVTPIVLSRDRPAMRGPPGARGSKATSPLAVGSMRHRKRAAVASRSGP